MKYLCASTSTSRSRRAQEVAPLAHSTHSTNPKWWMDNARTCSAQLANRCFPFCCCRQVHADDEHPEAHRLRRHPLCVAAVRLLPVRRLHLLRTQRHGMELLPPIASALRNRAVPRVHRSVRELEAQIIQVSRSACQSTKEGRSPLKSAESRFISLKLNLFLHPYPHRPFILSPNLA